MGALRRPPLYDTAAELYWRDPYVADHILDAHLDPTIDDASRRPTTIARSVAWIAEQAAGRQRVLDLGCGPGLYCEELAARGFQVTGVDFSERAIEYASGHAADSGLSIEYRLSDYRELDYRSDYDLVTLIYGGFCCLSNDDRNDLLDRVKVALSPGGLFIFDAFTESYIDRSRGTFYLRLRNGFWRPTPHLVIERGFDYPESDVRLDRYVVAGGRRGVETFDLWKHYYSRESLRAVLSEHGFEAVGWYGDLTGSEFKARSAWIGVVARPTT